MLLRWEIECCKINNNYVAVSRLGRALLQRLSVQLGLHGHCYRFGHLGHRSSLVQGLPYAGASTSLEPASSEPQSRHPASDPKIWSGKPSPTQRYLLRGSGHLRCHYGDHPAGKDQRIPMRQQLRRVRLLRLCTVLDRHLSRLLQPLLRVPPTSILESALACQAVAAL